MPAGVRIRRALRGEADVDGALEALQAAADGRARGSRPSSPEPVTRRMDGLVAFVTGGGSGHRARDRAAHARRRRARRRGRPATARRRPTASCRSSPTSPTRPRSTPRWRGRSTTFGGIDVLVNDAGIGAVGTVEANDDDEWKRVFDVNVLGIVRTLACRAPASPTFRAPGGRQPGVDRVDDRTPAARRATARPRARCSASRWRWRPTALRDHIRVNCVCPGTVDTPWVERLLGQTDDPDAARAALVARQPIGRLGTAEEIAAAIVYLASPEAGYVTGTALAIDGGTSGFQVPGGRRVDDDHHRALGARRPRADLADARRLRRRARRPRLLGCVRRAEHRRRAHRSRAHVHDRAGDRGRLRGRRGAAPPRGRGAASTTSSPTSPASGAR